MLINKNTNVNYTVRQLKLPLEIEKLIDSSDPIYTFCEVMDYIDLSKYFAEKGYKTGHPRCEEQKLLKVILFAFMENGICSLREIEKLCRNDIRYRYLLDGMQTPSFATFGNIIRKQLTDSVEQIFMDVNTYILEKDSIDLEHSERRLDNTSSRKGEREEKRFFHAVSEIEVIPRQAITVERRENDIPDTA